MNPSLLLVFTGLVEWVRCRSTGDRNPPTMSASEIGLCLPAGDGDSTEVGFFKVVGLRCVPPTSPSFFELAVEGFDRGGEAA